MALSNRHGAKGAKISPGEFSCSPGLRKKLPWRLLALLATWRLIKARSSPRAFLRRLAFAQNPELPSFALLDAG